MGSRGWVRSRSRWGRVPSAALGIALVAALLSGGEAAATSDTWSITVDTTLTEDHDGRFEIDADNVTLDCDGHTITGPGRLAGLPGIWLSGRTGVTVKNCVLVDFNDAFRVIDSHGNTFIGNSMSTLRQGFTLSGSTNNTIDGNTITDANDFFAISLGASSHGNTVTNNSVMDTPVGFYVEFSDNNTLTGNTATQVSGNAFDVKSSDGNTLSNNVASQVTNGFIVWEGAADNVLTDNQALDGGTGFELATSSHHNTLTNNTADGNSESGFLLSSGTHDNSVTSNLAKFNGSFGIDDSTTGSGSAGTASTYGTNRCDDNALGRSAPEGLCDFTLTNPCPTDPTPFADVAATSFAFDDVACIYGLEITTGTSGTTYSPADDVTREQMASFLARLWRIA